MAGYPSTVYRLDASGEIYEVVVEGADEKLRLDGVSALAMSTGYAEERFDVNAWWSKQLGSPLNAD